MAAIELNSTNLINDLQLRAYYRLSDVNDTTISSYDLINNNTVSFVASKFGDGADFGSTVNGAKSLSIASDLGITSGAITMACWVKLNNEITVNSGYYSFLEKSSATNVTYIIRYDHNSGTPRLQFIRKRNGTAEEVINYTITLGTADYYHLALTYDGSTVTGYVNGVSVGTISSTGVGASGGADKFYIGAGIVPASLTTSVIYSSSNTFVCPAGVTSIDVEAWGGGGNGGNGGGTPSGGVCVSGGGGGAYAAITGFSVTPGSSYTVTVGGSAGDSSFNTSSVIAKGGTSATGSNPGTPGTGGTAAASTGTTKFSGGNGGSAVAGQSASGGGGGAAGPAGNGNNGTGGGSTGTYAPGGSGNNGSGGAGGTGGGAGIANVNGGGGGSGGANNDGGGNGGAPGGGGGGGEDFGGTGASGQVRITYTLPTYESLAIVDDVAFFGYALSSTTVSGLYAGTLAAAGACGLDKLSTSASYNSIFRTKIFNIGTDFTIERIRIPLTNDIDAGTEIIATVFVDDSQFSVQLPTISSAIYNGQRYVVFHSPELSDCKGNTNFFIQFAFTGTTEIGIGFPIRITVDTGESK